MSTWLARKPSIAMNVIRWSDSAVITVITERNWLWRGSGSPASRSEQRAVAHVCRKLARSVITCCHTCSHRAGPGVSSTRSRAPAAARVRVAAHAAARRQAARPRRRARHRVRRDGRHERVVRADHPAVPRRARRSARGVGRSPRSRAPRRVRGRSAVRARRPRPSTARAPRWSRPSSCARSGRSTRSARTSISTGSTRPRSGSSAASEPYAGADDDARAVDTRVGTPGPIATRIDRALRAKFRDDQLKRAVVQFLVGGMKPGVHDDVIARRRRRVRAARRRARSELAKRFTIRGRVAVVDTAGAAGQFDKTDLLLAGQAARAGRRSCATPAC